MGLARAAERVRNTGMVNLPRSLWNYRPGRGRLQGPRLGRCSRSFRPSAGKLQDDASGSFFSADVRYTPKAAFVFAGDLEAFMRASYTARTVEGSPCCSEMLAVEVVMRAVVLVVVMLASGCTTVTPHGKAVQTAAYGGGFMAAGTLSVVTVSVGFGAAAAAIATNDEIPNRRARLGGC